MAWDEIRTSWPQLRDAVRIQWSALTDNDFETIAGQRDRLVGALHCRYDIDRDEVEAEIRFFERAVGSRFSRDSDPGAQSLTANQGGLGEEAG
jgi:uncharacterized protein YjbJ (UPF0337 family)